MFNSFTEKQKQYASYAEQLLKLQYVTQQLSRCNALLNQNMESLETLNNMLDPDDRLSPFIWEIADNEELWADHINFCQLLVYWISYFYKSAIAICT